MTSDVVVVGSGPNGLAAAIELARSGRTVRVLEAQDTVGGGMRSGELTLPGFVHDHCAAVIPLAVASPFFRALDLGVDWVQPDAPLAHPLDDGSAVLLERSVDDTAAGLGRDAAAYARLLRPLVRHAATLMDELLAPVHVFRSPLTMARFGLSAVRSAASLGRATFEGDRARALLAGCAAHSVLPLEAPITAAMGLVLLLTGHAYGWPIAAGGTQTLADALVARLRELGGDAETGSRVGSLDDVRGAHTTLLDVTPRQLASIGGARLPDRYRQRLLRFRHGPGVFKLDWALDGPVPWKASECLRAGTVHVGGTLEEIVRSEDEVAKGLHAERPFVLVVQPTLFDASRAPAGRHTLWAYCHVPNRSTVDMTDAIERQIERFAPGFRERVLARAATFPADLERSNESLPGGDITGGVADWRQHFMRPMPSLHPYSTPLDGVYLCSASTPPGAAVHGMCGYHAARAALRANRGRVPRSAS